MMMQHPMGLQSLKVYVILLVVYREHTCLRLTAEYVASVFSEC